MNNRIPPSTTPERPAPPRPPERPAPPRPPERPAPPRQPERPIIKKRPVIISEGSNIPTQIVVPTMPPVKPPKKD